MDIQRAVREFVSEGQDLYRRLRSRGETVSDVDLVALREQLHILDIAAGHLQELKEFRSDGFPFILGDKRQQITKSLSHKAA